MELIDSIRCKWRKNSEMEKKWKRNLNTSCLSLKERRLTFRTNFLFVFVLTITR